MSQPTNRWKLGLFVLAGIAALLVTVAWLGARALSRETTQLHVFFDQEVTGLEVGAPMYFRGIQIGKVGVIRAAPDRRHVEVLIDVFLDSLRDLGFLAPEGLDDGNSEGEPPEDLRVQLVASLITGVATLESDFVDVAEFPPPNYPFPVPRNTLHPIPSSFNRLEQAMLESFTRLPDLLDQTSATLVSVERAVEELNAAQLSDRAEALLATLDEQAAKLYELPMFQTSSTSFEELTETLKEARGFLTDLRAEESPFQLLVARYAGLGERLDAILEDSDVPGTMASLRDTTGSFSGAGASIEALGRETRNELDSLRQTLAAARRLFELLERDPAALLRGR